MELNQSKLLLICILGLLLLIGITILSGFGIKQVPGSESQISLSKWVSQGVDWVASQFAGLFKIVSVVLTTIHTSLFRAMMVFPVYEINFGLFSLLIPTLALVLFFGAWLVTGKFQIGLMSFIILWLILFIGLWEMALNTIALTLTAASIAIFLGVPLGILIAWLDWLEMIIQPVLDFMQTMPPFVYLIPSVIFFGLGAAPGIIATVIYALPPPVRLTNLGIREVPESLVQAGRAFGCSRFQLLRKVEIPVALSSIMVGINQAIMMSLAMVIIAALIGAGGLGEEIVWGITRMQVGKGVVAGLGVVGIAIMLDRITQNVTADSKDRG